MHQATPMTDAEAERLAHVLGKISRLSIGGSLMTGLAFLHSTEAAVATLSITSLGISVIVLWSWLQFRGAKA